VKRTSLITLVLGFALAIVPAVGAMPVAETEGGTGTPVVVHTDVLGGNGSAVQATAPTGMTQAEARALRIRGEALNRQYGNAVTKLSPSEFASLYLFGADKLSPQEFAALIARDQALNQTYGIGGTAKPVTFRPDTLGGNGGVATREAPVATGGDSFPWPATIGASVIAVLMLALASVAVTRRRQHRLGF
jgi:hypothetical protein